MSWLPMYNSFMIFITLVSLIFWNLGGVLLFIMMLVFSVYFLVKEVYKTSLHYIHGFWLFMLSEVIMFFSLFYICLWTKENVNTCISDSMELPFLGCFLLLGSSITATAYHHSLGGSLSLVWLCLTMFLGSCFVLLQMFEFYDCFCDLLYSSYYAVAFCTVGLHFSHVLMGLVGLTILFFLGGSLKDMYYADVGVWYWHFVDYIWLLVFMFMYVC
uniref:cytochrome c oxidase subunit 3 n=1 Tax=Allocreadium lobatum TaxID=334451 RepID=UPI0030027F2A|nr:cytochrome c oxidase subunit 3 [Allocreadium lobatum]